MTPQDERLIAEAEGYACQYVDARERFAWPDREAVWSGVRAGYLAASAELAKLRAECSSMGKLLQGGIVVPNEEFAELSRLKRAYEHQRAALVSIHTLAKEGDAWPHGGTSVLTLLEIARTALREAGEIREGKA